MGNLGLGVMIHELGGGSEHLPNEYVGLTITDVVMDENQVMIEFNNGRKIKISDEGQSCCESRYMTTDDNISDLIGKQLISIDDKPVQYENGDYDVHEMCFVEIVTDGGNVTLVNHNEHNGYYGGFALNIKELNN